MILKRTNAIDGKENSMEIPLTPLEFVIGENRRNEGGELIQNVYPQLNADQREFIMTGITPELWDKMFGEPKEGYVIKSPKKPYKFKFKA